MIDEDEAELVDLLERAEPLVVARAIAHAAGRLAHLDGAETAAQAARNIAAALERLRPVHA